MRLSCLNRKNRGAVKTPLALREVGPATVRHPAARKNSLSRGRQPFPPRGEQREHPRREGGSAPHREVWAEAMPRRGEEATGQPGARLYRKQRKVSYSPEAEDIAEVRLAANSEEVVEGSDVAAIRAAISRSMSTSCSGEKREGSNVAPASALLPAAAPGSASDPVAIARKVARKKFELANPADRLAAATANSGYHEAHNAITHAPAALRNLTTGGSCACLPVC